MTYARFLVFRVGVEWVATRQCSPEIEFFPEWRDAFNYALWRLKEIGTTSPSSEACPASSASTTG